MPATLLHLVSDQTMQNLLPLLALRPRTVVQVRSKDPRFRAVAEHLKSAVAAIQKTAPYSGLAPDFFEVVIDKDSPDADATRQKVGESLSLWPDAVVNLTGGTKPMSIGAYLAADYQREPVLYCDTQARTFVSLNSRRPLPNLPAFDAIAATLTVEAVMAAHGVSPAGWKEVVPETNRIQFGKRALKCRLDHESEILKFAAELRQEFKPKDKHLSSAEFAARNLEPITALRTPGVASYLQLAADLGIVVEDPDGFRFAPHLTNRRIRETAIDLLEGGWLELGVFERLTQDTRFGDPRWSVQPSHSESAGFGETDVVCVDRKFTALALFSCKSTPPRQGLEHLEALRQRKETLGGRFARATLCVGHCPAGDRERLSVWCRALGIDLLTGRQIMDSIGSPSPTGA